MSKYLTVVIRMPEDEEMNGHVSSALEQLSPYITGMSQEDEMTVLELIEQHADFESHIAEEARVKTAELHAATEAIPA